MNNFYTYQICSNLISGFPDSVRLRLHHYKQYDDIGIARLPLLTLSSSVHSSTYRQMTYGYPVQMLACMEDLLGKDTMQQCMKGFFDSWKYKSPCPYDFTFFFNNKSSRDLNWFWDHWFMHFGHIDLSIGNVTKYMVTIVNTGFLPVPFDLVTTDKKGVVQKIHYRTGCWEKGNGLKIQLNTENLTKIEVKHSSIYLAEANEKDNIWIR